MLAPIPSTRAANPLMVHGPIMSTPYFEHLRRDLDFILYPLMGIERLCERPAFANHSRETFDAVINAALRLAADHFEPHAALADREEPRIVGGRVTLPAAVGEALEAFREGGFLAASFSEDDGGLGLPYAVTQAMMAAFYGANPSTAAYPLLTAAAANLLRAFGSASQKQRFMRPMLEGRFFGTMCLSEPQAGSGLSDLRTLAHPQADGRYHLVGDKMWISGGEHDLSETIVHLVLARLPEAPLGVKGISLFIVPKHQVDASGALGALNGITLTGLNHKMGYRGTVNTALAFGSERPAVGELVGEPHQGLRYMFHMMNEARVGVGLGASMLGYAGYRHAVHYARERQQGRHPDQRAPNTPPAFIIDHADVRRMLLTQRVYAEGGMALAIYCARLIDEMATAVDDETRQSRDDLLQILTPIAKAWPSAHGPAANDLAIQVLGGYGYTRDFPVERFYRDNRLNPIHEGTNGIQGLDLLGRKVTMHGGRAFRALITEIGTAVERNADRLASSGLAELTSDLKAALDEANETTMVLAGAAMKGELRLFLANASTYLDMLGNVVVAWMWMEQAATAARLLEEGDERFLRGKLSAARFFFRYELPKIRIQAELLRRLDDTTLNLDPDAL